MNNINKSGVAKSSKMNIGQGKVLALYTLGCKTNQYESDALTQAFKVKGFETTEFSNRADVYIINTCTVTSLSDRKSRQAIRKAKKLNPEAIVAVIGCYAQISPEEIEAIDGVTIVLGTKDRMQLVQLVEDAITNRQLKLADKDLEFSSDKKDSETRNDKKHDGVAFSEISNIMDAEYFEEMALAIPNDRTRAYVKIQEGCNQFCTYCIIPYARGPIRSRQPKKIEAEVKKLAENGFKEIVITGIHIASYGVEIGNTSLIEILTLINSIDGIERIRLGSLEPNLMKESFLQPASMLEKLCPHFHVSLQSGSNNILKAMNRKYTREEYLEGTKILRKYFPNAAITTDIMVGFPGESQSDFDETMELAKRVSFSDIHVFKFSPRKGTPAALFPEQISPEVKDERSEKLISLANLLNSKFLDSFIGKELDVIVERKVNETGNLYEGLSNNYINVIVNSDNSVLGKLIKVYINSREGNNLVAHQA